MTEQLTELAKPFPRGYLGKDDRGNDAVDHTVVTQRLLQIVGPYSMEVREVLRSDVPDFTTKNNKVYPGGHYVTGVVLRLLLKIDGEKVWVDEAGGCENAALKDGDGERLKHAISDAIKRCAMRLGLGLHMWAGDHFFLYQVLTREASPAAAGKAVPTPDELAQQDDDGSEAGTVVTQGGEGTTTDGAGGHQPPMEQSDPPPPQPEVEDPRAGIRRRFFAILGELATDQAGDNPDLTDAWKEAAHALVKHRYQVDSTNDIPAGDFTTFLNAVSTKDDVRARFVTAVNEWIADPPDGDGGPADPREAIRKTLAGADA